MNKVQFYHPFMKRPDVPNFNGTSQIPPTNIFKSDDGYVLEIAVPGFKKEEIDISLKDSKLSIKGKSEVTEEVEAKFVQRGFTKKSFDLSFGLSEQIDQETIDAKIENGVLKITLRYKAEVKSAPKNILIQ